MNGVKDIERRRTIRIRRSALLKSDLGELDRPAIKIAETAGEFEQSFAMVYKEYADSGYIPVPQENGLLFNHFNFLPETVLFIAKSYEEVISTLTQVFDSETFGLPMDSIYHEELEDLRRDGRKISEIGALATKKDFRWQNLFMYICRVMYWYSNYQQVDDLCIAVNPKHVRFYETIFLFEQFGPEKTYPKVDAPAVLLRLDMHKIKDKLKNTYAKEDFECNLFEYFHRINDTHVEDYSNALASKGVVTDSYSKFTPEIASHFFQMDKALFNSLELHQREYLKGLFPGLSFPWEKRQLK
jgi:hypothetical protein